MRPSGCSSWPARPPTSSCTTSPSSWSGPANSPPASSDYGDTDHRTGRDPASAEPGGVAAALPLPVHRDRAERGRRGVEAPDCGSQLWRSKPGAVMASETHLGALVESALER